MKRLSYYILFLFIFLVNVCPVYAYDATKPFDPKDVSTWNQGVTDECKTRLLCKGSGHTIMSAGCSYFAMYYILVKGGYLDPTKETPIDVIDRVEKYNGWDTSWGHMDGSLVSKLEPDLKCEKYMMQLTSYSTKEVKTILKGLYEEGKYLQVSVGATGGPLPTSGHYIFIDGFDDKGDYIIGDSGRGGTKWNDYYGKCGGYFKYVTVYSSKKGIKCNKMPSIYSKDVGKRGKGSGKSSMSDDEKSEYKDIISEWELNGMPPSEKVEDVQIQIELPEGFDNVKYTKNVQQIKDGISADKKGIEYFAHTASSFIGIMLILYSVLLFVAILFDYSNSFVEFSLLKLLTFGRVSILDEEDIKNHSKNVGWDSTVCRSFMSYKMLFVRCGVVLVLGLLLVSNFLFDVVIKVLTGV